MTSSRGQALEHVRWRFFQLTGLKVCSHVMLWIMCVTQTLQICKCAHSLI